MPSSENAPAWSQHGKTVPRCVGGIAANEPQFGRLPIVRPPLVHDDRGAIRAWASGRMMDSHGISNEIGDEGWWRSVQDGGGGVQPCSVAHIQPCAILEKLVFRDMVIAAARVMVLRIAPVGRRVSSRPRAGSPSSRDRTGCPRWYCSWPCSIATARAIAPEIVAANLGLVAISGPHAVLTPPGAIREESCCG